MIAFRFGLLEKRLVLRGLYMWLLVRTFAGVAVAMAEASPIKLDPKASVLVIATTAYLGWLETQRRPEHVLLANLGTSKEAALALLTGSAASLEILSALLVRI